MASLARLAKLSISSVVIHKDGLLDIVFFFVLTTTFVAATFSPSSHGILLLESKKLEEKGGDGGNGGGPLCCGSSAEIFFLNVSLESRLLKAFHSTSTCKFISPGPDPSEVPCQETSRDRSIESSFGFRKIVLVCRRRAENELAQFGSSLSPLVCINRRHCSVLVAAAVLVVAAAFTDLEEG